MEKSQNMESYLYKDNIRSNNFSTSPLFCIKKGLRGVNLQ